MPSANSYQSSTNTPDSLGRRGVVVTPDPANDLPSNVKAIFCLTAGNVSFIPVGNADNEIITLTGIPANFIPPWRIRRVTASTSTVYTIES